MPVIVQVRGIEQLRRELSRLSTAVSGRLAANASMAGARIVVRRAKVLAPVKTGALRASIKARRPPQGQAAGQRSALAGSTLFYAKFVELGVAHAPARSFLRRAVDESTVEIRAKIEQNLSAGIDREVRKQRVAIDPGDGE